MLLIRKIHKQKDTENLIITITQLNREITVILIPDKMRAGL